MTRPVSLATAATVAGLLLALCAHHVAALTNPDELERMIQFRDAMFARSPSTNWKKALASWTCPTPSDNTVGGTCDPCGQQVWGNWDHLACRGRRISETKYEVPGTGVLTNVHITDYGIEGAVPLEELCSFKSLTEFDVDGGDLEGPIPTGFAQCFPRLAEIDLSYNRLTGEIPPEIADIKTLEQFKLEVNNISGSIPAALGSMDKIIWFRFGKNRMSGRIPQSFVNTAPHLSQLTLDTNNFEGNLYPLANHRMISFTAHSNPKLCGMVPVGVRFGHGFNYYNTGLGMPCPEEIANGIETD